MKPNIRVEQYQIAPEQFSIGGVQWLTKWDVKIQFSDQDTAYAWKDKIEKILKGEVPKRQPLTTDEIDDIGNKYSGEMGCIEQDNWEAFVRAVEAAHDIKETK